MSGLIDEMLSPNFWVWVASLLGIGGIICMVIGFFTGSRALMNIGMWLFAPLFLGGVLLLVVVIPALIVDNQRLKRK